MTNFWSLVLDETKPLFTTEKFLSQASDESKAAHSAAHNTFSVTTSQTRLTTLLHDYRQNDYHDYFDHY